MRNSESKLKAGACVLLLLLATAATLIYDAHTRVPSWRCERLPAANAQTEHTIFFFKGIIAVGG